MMPVRRTAARLATGALLSVPCFAVAAAFAEPPDIEPIGQRLDPGDRHKASADRCPPSAVLSTQPPPKGHRPCYDRWLDMQRYIATLPRFPV